MKQTLFQEVLGGSKQIRVLEYMLEWNHIPDMNLTDIAKGAGTSRTPARQIIKSLIKKGIVTKTRKIGSVSMYRINDKHPISKALIRLFKEVVDYYFEQKITRR